MSNQLPPSPTLLISINHITDTPIDFDIKQYVQLILQLKQIHTGQFEFSFTSNDHIIAINKQYLNRSYSTDIISFNLGTPDDIIGDVYISVEQALINAIEYEQSFNTEIKRLIIHGILHLLDYHDYTPEEKEVMYREQESLLQEAETP